MTWIRAAAGGPPGGTLAAMLRAHRAIEVSDLDELTEVLAVCQGRRWPTGRRLAVVTGLITTVAGNGISGDSGDGGPMNAAIFLMLGCIGGVLLRR